jgi:hypothetical protein
VLVLLLLLGWITVSGAPPPSGESKSSKTAHEQRMTGATAVHGEEGDRSRGEGMGMEDVVWDGSAALLRGVWVTCGTRLSVIIILGETTR